MLLLRILSSIFWFSHSLGRTRKFLVEYLSKLVR